MLYNNNEWKMHIATLEAARRRICLLRCHVVQRLGSASTIMIISIHNFSPFDAKLGGEYERIKTRGDGNVICILVR